jgi:hypothetical protein
LRGAANLLNRSKANINLLLRRRNALGAAHKTLLAEGGLARLALLVGILARAQDHWASLGPSTAPQEVGQVAISLADAHIKLLKLPAARSGRRGAAGNGASADVVKLDGGPTIVLVPVSVGHVFFVP